MTELTKTEFCNILEIALLNYEGEPLNQFIGKVDYRCITLGRKVLEFIKQEW